MRKFLVMFALLLAGCRGGIVHDAVPAGGEVSEWQSTVYVDADPLPVVGNGLHWAAHSRRAREQVRDDGEVARSLVMRCDSAEAIAAAKQVFEFRGSRFGWMHIAIVAYNPIVARRRGNLPKQGIGNCKLMTYAYFANVHRAKFDDSLFVRLPNPPSAFIEIDHVGKPEIGTTPSRYMSDGITRG